MRIELAVSAGELVDRMTILELKSRRIAAGIASEPLEASQHEKPAQLQSAAPLGAMPLERVSVGATRVEAEIRQELSRVRAVCERELTPSPRLDELMQALRVVNGQLWDLEEALRACERTACFGERFIELARQVYKANDWRAALKRSVDELLGSEIREHKSHPLPVVERSAARSALARRRAGAGG